MAYKALIFGTDDLYPKLKPLYDAEVQRGNLEIVAEAELTNDMINFAYADDKWGGGEYYDSSNFDLAIISSRTRFYSRMKRAETLGFSRNKIIDGRVFKVPNLDLSRLIKEGIAYGTTERDITWNDCLPLNHSRVYSIKNYLTNNVVSVGQKTYICGITVEGIGDISFGKFCSVASQIKFRLGINNGHDYKRISSYEITEFEWNIPAEFLPPRGKCQVNIGSDVWIGRGCILKSTNPDKPLIIGDGAVIAADSVVVKNVPPYAIVGGNPAKIIKYRFEPHIIEALLRIKWWDWSLDKIHDNFKYFNDVEKFISLNDRS